MTKIVHLQTHLPSSGNAAYKLHKAFLEVGIDSSMLSLTSDLPEDERIKFMGLKAQLLSRIKNKLHYILTRKTIRKFGLFSFPIIGANVARLKQIQEADIIYLHWIVGGFLNLSNIDRLARLNKPIVFFMHDMWTITGGCHHSFECEKYKTKCGKCQVFASHKNNDLSAIEMRKKKKIYSRHNNLYFVAPSMWLYNCAKQSLLTKDKPVYYIPNVIDQRLFKPFRKSIAKQILNIEIIETVVAFGAVSVDSPYKGWSYLQEAMEILANHQVGKSITVLIFGSGYDKQTEDSIPFRTKFMGRLRDDYSLALAYNAADVVVSPSLADNMPLVILESLCCGTPVVGFDVGGIPDLIDHKVNGYLSKYRNAQDLALGIKYCIENNVQGHMLPQFNKEKSIKKHIEIIKGIMEDGK